jgi:hypothetical protein
MKSSFIICVLSLFNSILNFKNEFDLTNEYSKRIEQLEEGINCNLYISAIKYQKFQISLIINNINKRPFPYLYIYEKTSKTNNYIDKSIFYPIKTKIENNKLNITFSYTTSAINSGYVTIKFTPIYNISYINVEINGHKNALTPYYIYNLHDNYTQTYYNLTKDIKYYFILAADFLMTAKIKIDMSLSNYLTNNDITVQEISNKNNIFDFNGGKTYALKGSIINDVIYNFNPLDYMLTYPSSKYLLLNFIPKYNISNFSIRVELRGKIYNLSKSYSSTSLNIYYVGPYYFILKSNEEYKSVNVSFKTNKFIDYLEYDELADKFSSVKFGKKVSLINKKSGYNEFISSFLCDFSSLSKIDKTIIFKLEPLNSSNIYVQYDFNYIYNKSIYIGNYGNIFNLVKGNEYNFKAYASSRNISIEITFSNIYNNDLPFNYFIIKEYINSNSNSYIKRTTK